jgi:hypothetical protein
MRTDPLNWNYAVDDTDGAVLIGMVRDPSTKVSLPGLCEFCCDRNPFW